MKAKVDKTLCIGCGLCESICPKVFRMNDEGTAEATEGEIDPSCIDDAKDAKNQCPVEAIDIEE